MSFLGNTRHTPAAAAAAAASADHRMALMNLSAVQSRMDSLHRLLSDSVNANARLGQPRLDAVSSEISAAIHQIIINGAALLSCNPPLISPHPNPNTNTDPKVEIQFDDESDDRDVIEIDAVELLAEHVHFCEICGKGFKRDANLRMHMRAHGNQFKTREALSRPDRNDVVLAGRTSRFSCPYVGCNRNKGHKRFRPLKSAVCVKNHFRRSHCPKMYSCDRCNKKRFSVLADLRNHLRHCGESKWRCSCGTRFSRKDKLFGHMAMFEGHMPAVMDEGAVAAVVEEEETNMKGELESKDGFFEGLVDGFGSVDDDYCFRDVLSSPNFVDDLDSGMEGFFEF